MRNHYLRASGVPSSGGGGGSFITDDLTFHIDAGNTSSYSGSGTTVNSLVGSITNSGFNSNVTYSSDDGGGWVFSNSPSTGSGIEFPNGSYFDFGNESFTIEMWFTYSGSSNRFLAGFTGSSNEYVPYFNGSGLFIHIGNNLPRPDMESGASFTYNDWNHYVLSVDKESHAANTTVVLYINGSTSYDAPNDGSKTYFNFQPTMSFTSSQKFYIGGNSTWNTFPHQGKISIVRLYKGKALTSSEVATNYSAESSRYT